MAELAGIEILSPGLQTTIQDLGRFGFSHYGVPPSGALDSFSLRIANRLVGNPEDQACLETALLGLRFKALDDVCIAVTGGNLQPQVNKCSFEMWRSHVLKKDEILTFAGPVSGCRAYVAFGGALKILPTLGSLSTNLAAGFGGFEGRPLQKGDMLQIGSAQLKLTAAGRKVKSEWIPAFTATWTLRVLWGPQDDEFTQAVKHVFTHSSYSVTSQSDRTGVRLNGPEIARKSDTPESIVSEGLVAGSIQVPGDGQPIIVLGETVTGGYRKIATVISADLPLVGQIKPGDEIDFKPVSIDAAGAALMEMEGKIKNAVSL